MNSVSFSTLYRCCVRPRPQVTPAVIPKYKSSTRSSTRTLLSAAHKTQQASTSDSSRSRNRRSVSAGLHSITPAAQPASAAEPLHQFVRCQHGFQLGSLYLSHWAGSPVKATAPRTKISVEVSVVAHPPDWDADAFISSQLSQMAPTGQLAARLPAVAAGSTAQPSAAAAGSNSSSPVWSSSAAKDGKYTSGPLPAFAIRYRANGETSVVGLKGHDIPGYARGVFDIVLQEQVGPAAFILHVKPHSPDAPKQSARPVSLVGQGPGLQVFPGSIPEVSCDVGVRISQDNKRAQLSVVKALVFSQLPGVRCPAPVNITVKDPQGAQPDDCFTAKMYFDKRDGTYRIRVPGSHPLAAYAGRRIIRMALTPGAQLTLYLAPATAAAAAPNSSTGPAAGASAAGGGAAVKQRR